MPSRTAEVQAAQDPRSKVLTVLFEQPTASSAAAPAEPVRRPLKRVLQDTTTKPSLTVKATSGPLGEQGYGVYQLVT